MMGFMVVHMNGTTGYGCADTPSGRHARGAPHLPLTVSTQLVDRADAALRVLRGADRPTVGNTVDVKRVSLPSRNQVLEKLVDGNVVALAAAKAELHRHKSHASTDTLDMGIYRQDVHAQRVHGDGTVNSAGDEHG